MGNTVHSLTMVELAFQIGRLSFKGILFWIRVKGGCGNDLATEVSTTEGNT